jgi:hypothetical protein
MKVSKDQDVTAAPPGFKSAWADGGAFYLTVASPGAEIVGAWTENPAGKPCNKVVIRGGALTAVEAPLPSVADMENCQMNASTPARSRSGSLLKTVQCVIAAVAIVAASEASAVIVGLDIVRTESPTFGGKTFGTVGTYDKIVARARGTLNPTDVHNARMTDISLAPHNVHGLLADSMEF